MKNGYDELLKNRNRDEEPMTENDDDELRRNVVIIENGVDNR
jgi:hypothetical protein